MLIAAALIVGLAHHAEESTPRQLRALVTEYDHPRDALEVMLVRGDGQIFAALARDPSLSHPEVFRYGSFDAAYRAQRPLLGYLSWALSGGDPTRVPMAMAILAVLGAGLATGTLAGFLTRPWLALLIVPSPAGLAVLYSLTPELLALGLALAGVLAWQRDKRYLAVVCFTLAGLGRESMLLFPAACAAAEVVGRRRPPGALAIPFATWLGWAALAHARFGEPLWPLSAGGDLGAPFAEMFRQLDRWEPMDVLTVVLAGAATAAAAVAVRRRRDGLLPWAGLAFAAFATLLGASIWAQWFNSARLLLPLYAAGLAAIYGREPDRGSARPGDETRWVGGTTVETGRSSA